MLPYKHIKNSESNQKTKYVQPRCCGAASSSPAPLCTSPSLAVKSAQVQSPESGALRKTNAKKTFTTIYLCTLKYECIKTFNPWNLQSDSIMTWLEKQVMLLETICPEPKKIRQTTVFNIKQCVNHNSTVTLSNSYSTPKI